MNCFPPTTSGAIFFNDKKVYAARAEGAIATGHVAGDWKKHVSDLGRLNAKDYDYLMRVVDRVRNAMKRALGVEKVYLLYMDETKHVHWHLVPRYNEEGFDVFHHKPKKLKSTVLARKLEKTLQ